MKKITATMETPHNDFEHQLKDLLNDLSDLMSHVAKEQQVMAQWQNKMLIKDHLESFNSSICGDCQDQADIITVTIADGRYKSFCNDCLNKIK